MYMEWILNSLAWYQDQSVQSYFSFLLQKSMKYSEQKRKKK
uniref:Alternative protein UCHL3 n=1 Tax=Homo sapiens TaxID=9606 RepID=L8EAH4_HUMAN|nr:alternative protein UCHL3 [Homo sapiens]